LSLDSPQFAELRTCWKTFFLQSTTKASSYDLRTAFQAAFARSRSRQHVLTSFEIAVTGPRRDLWLAALPALTRGRPRLAAWLRATVETTLAAVGLDEDN